jgi:hypothetical protein
MLPQRSQAQNPIIKLLTLTFSRYRRPACDLVRQRSRANPLLPAATGGARTKGDHRLSTFPKGESAREGTGQQSHSLAQEKDRSRYRVGAGRSVDAGREQGQLQTNAAGAVSSLTSGGGLGFQGWIAVSEPKSGLRDE